MFKIKDLCIKFNLSRSTLLYYDSIGLLKPIIRTNANYRIYSDADVLRLEKICNFREAGISLEDIKGLLDLEETQNSNILTHRFNQINQEIQNLKNQQACIASMLKNNTILATTELICKDTWNKLMHSTGFDEISSKNWHVLFEQISSNEHTTFLRSLGLSAIEIEKIKSFSTDDIK